MQKLLCLSLWLVVAAVVPVAHANAPRASATTPASAVPPLLTAGILRIEAERSYKLGLQNILRILDGHARKELERSSSKVLDSYKVLVALPDKTQRTGQALDRAGRALDEHIRSMTQLNPETANSTYDINENLLSKLNALSFSLESERNDQNSRVVALALRQASLAQRLAKITLLRSLSKASSNRRGLQVDLVQSKVEFTNGLNLLQAEAASNRYLADRVELARQQWIFYGDALNSGSTDANHLRDVSTTSDRIAELMIEIVRVAYSMSPNANAMSFVTQPRIQEIAV